MTGQPWPPVFTFILLLRMVKLRIQKEWWKLKNKWNTRSVKRSLPNRKAFFAFMGSFLKNTSKKDHLYNYSGYSRPCIILYPIYNHL